MSKLCGCTFMVLMSKGSFEELIFSALLLRLTFLCSHGYQTLFRSAFFTAYMTFELVMGEQSAAKPGRLTPTRSRKSSAKIN